MNNLNKQQGFTITELMIAITLGMTIISSILLGYLATYTSSLNTLAGSRLNQELSTLMSIMVNDIRRAGYNGESPAILPSTNPFNIAGVTTLGVFQTLTNTDQGPTGNGSCIVYAYNLDGDNNPNPSDNVDANEVLGFRLNGNAVQVRTLGDPADPYQCDNSSGTWLTMTDPTFITITALNFDLSLSACLNTREPDLIDNDGDMNIDEPDEYDCYSAVPVDTGDITVESRQVTITLTGQLTNDAFVRMSLSQEVRVRNEYVRIR